MENTDALVKENEGGEDYRLNGRSCWVAVDGYVVFIAKKNGGGVGVEIYEDKHGTINQLLASASVVPS